MILSRVYRALNNSLRLLLHSFHNCDRMPYRWTLGPPDMSMALHTGDPRHVTRPPKRKDPEEHIHGIREEELHGAEIILEEYSADHNSRNTYYRLEECMPADCVVTRADDPRIKWRYSRGSRQCARPYMEGLQPSTTPFVKKSADRNGSLRTIHTVPPELVPSAPNEPVPPGDVVALWQRRVQNGDKDGAAEICSLLRTGGHICVYPL